MRLRRRDLIVMAVGAAIVRPAAARAALTLPVIGFLHSQSAGLWAPLVAAFRAGLADTGYVEGRNVNIEYRWAEGYLDRLPSLAAELVSMKVTCIATAGGPATALAAKAATSTIPIVFNSGTDPVVQGLVRSLNRPGGNLTGVTFFLTETLGKRVQFMREILPGATVAVLLNPAGADAASESREIEALMKAGLRLLVLRVTTDAEVEAAFATIAERKVRLLVLAGDPFFKTRAKTIPALALHNRVALAGNDRDYRGQLLSYGINLGDAYRQVGILVGEILGGAEPANLPVRRVDKLELVIDMKTAKMLDLTIPAPLIARADEVIE